jgi:hypothetical protein
VQQKPKKDTKILKAVGQRPALLETYSPLLIRPNMQSGEIFGSTRTLTVFTSSRCRRVCQVAVASALHKQVEGFNAELRRDTGAGECGHNSMPGNRLSYAY